MNFRLKSYYIADDITPNLYTNGDEYIIVETGQSYTGPYHTYNTGEVFTLSNWNPNQSKKLIKIGVAENTNNSPNVFIYKQLNDIKTKYKSIKPAVPIITNNDKKLGYITRYFIKKINNNNVIEIDKQQFNDWESEKIDPNLYFAINVKWTIAGNLQDTINNGVTIESVSTLNRTEINRASKQMSEITNVLSDLTQYYVDMDIVTPIDINTTTTPITTNTTSTSTTSTSTTSGY